MPPALRRSSSSPSVRSSAAPYPNIGMLPPGSRSNGHRRSTGSETSIRRVLQDIEWWRVTDGQFTHEEDSEEQDQPTDGAGSPLELAPVAEMAALSISPSRHGQESSTSSVESTPDQAQPSALFQPDTPPPALRRTRSDTSPVMLSMLSIDDLEHQYADFATSPLSSPLLFSH
ncbi:hypothetical protein MIND_01018200 [Mycena indigotica]|uniref:Uncharacterized protein n=1 Tax=Mycena indigotica TaxID=2126181 RepID=A0A8H6SBH3_9AGAR|nr:uncharacterized protein MIND_01018200 [Mycena indigotica]KAF7294805.1 hypothetical protein MIND_01018200 [Mycena indigotica]